MTEAARARLLAGLGLLVLAALVASGVSPHDRATWLLEVAPVLIAAPVLGATWRRYPLTTLLYALIALHMLVLILGGAYTYARVPLGFWLQDALHLARNPYDKIGHFMQGLVPAMVAREVLLQRGYVSSRGMAAFLSVCVAMAISAVYELIEWGVALAAGSGATDFLGTQGDVWDTQSDMFWALLGAMVAVTVLRGWHDRQIRAMSY
ncbi:DUF2238 domain-containing protein [Polaromonas hydrogenivorans]|uniref:DUF2238 domain-containing protein n=1 Tax=Polaromonas hydrogenivorans TaxID=335476 RepID=A0AAU7LQL9_9BURK